MVRVRATVSGLPEADRVAGPLRIDGRWVLASNELSWRFSRSSGPGGQGVNTADSRVELSWTPARSDSLAALPEVLRLRVRERLRSRLTGGSVVITASEYRAQLRNREAARRRLAQLLREAIAAPPRTRAATRPTRGSVERRLQAKKARSRTLGNRRPVNE